MGMQEEITEVVGSNPFKIMGIVKTLKNNVVTTVSLKTCLENIFHNIKVLVNGLKDGMYKGLFSPASTRKSIAANGAPKQAKTKAGAPASAKKVAVAPAQESSMHSGRGSRPAWE